MTGIIEALTIAGTALGTLDQATGIAHDIGGLLRKGDKKALIEAEKMILDLLKNLNETQRTQIALERSLAELQKIQDQQDNFTRQAARYELAETDMGGRVYTLKKDHHNDEPPHEVCATCMGKSVISILQFSTTAYNTLTCPVCGTSVHKEGPQQPFIGTVRSSDPGIF